MHPKLDNTDKPANDAPSSKALARFTPQAKRPNLQERPPRRLPTMAVVAVCVAGTTGLMLGVEAYAPPAGKPSRFTGGYETAIQQARKTGELAAQVKYDARAKGIELHYQGEFKRIETSALQWGEQYKAALSAYTASYPATYQRAQMYAQTTADIQKQYMGYRFAVTQGTLGGEMAVANTATMVGLFGGLFSPELEQSSLAFAEKARQQALAKLDASARGGVTISIEGWNTGLPDPEELARKVYDLPPLELPKFTPVPITEPEAPSTAKR